MHPAVRHLAAGLAAVALLVSVVLPVSAKEFLEARLDAPIAMDTPAGTEILVGVTVTVPDENGTMVGVEGSPIQLILTGRYGATTRAAGVADGKLGHYVMRIAIPAGGARDAEVVIHGTSDLPIMLAASALTFGGVTARTAQVAPPLAAAMTPFPRASAVAAAPVAAAPANDPAAVAAVPVTEPAAASSSPGVSPVVALVLGILAFALALGVMAAVRRSRATRRLSAAGRVPGA